MADIRAEAMVITFKERIEARLSMVRAEASYAAENGKLQGFIEALIRIAVGGYAEFIYEGILAFERSGGSLKNLMDFLKSNPEKVSLLLNGVDR